jgi:hypothetical protein
LRFGNGEALGLFAPPIAHDGAGYEMPSRRDDRVGLFSSPRNAMIAEEAARLRKGRP